MQIYEDNEVGLTDGETARTELLLEDIRMAQGEYVEIHRPDGMRRDQMVEGEEYLYSAAWPAYATGKRYRLLRFVKDVPSYQVKCLVEALEGEDRGHWFICSIENFRTRYRPVPVPPTPEKVLVVVIGIL